MVAFRKIGVPNTKVCQYLRRVRRTIEASLPDVSARAIHKIKQGVAAAYDLLPLQRLATVKATLDGTISGAVLRHVHHDLGKVIQELSTVDKPVKKPEPDEAFRLFLRQASERGWRVAEPVEQTTVQQDGFIESINYIRSVAVAQDTFLGPAVDCGVVSAPILLLHGYAVPKNILLSWTRPPLNYQVCMVFGRYVVATPMQFIGIKASLVERQLDDCVYVDETKFGAVAQSLGITQDVVRSPQRFFGHYYCPCLTVQSTTRRFMVGWDIPRQGA